MTVDWIVPLFDILWRLSSTVSEQAIWITNYINLIQDHYAPCLICVIKLDDHLWFGSTFKLAPDDYGT